MNDDKKETTQLPDESKALITQVDTEGEAKTTAAGKEKGADDDVKTKSLSQIIRDQVTEEDTKVPLGKLTLRRVMGGDILTAEIVRRQIWLFLLIAMFAIMYIAQGYKYKNYLIDIDKLNTQLKEAKFKALSTKSDVTELTRESHVLDMLKQNHDTTLQSTDRTPYIVNVPEN